VACTYWLARGAVQWARLVLVPPRAPPGFFEAAAGVVGTDLQVRFVFMAAKALVLCRGACPGAGGGGGGRALRRQGHLLTAVEHASLLYRCVLPVPVWASFFLAGHDLFASLTTGLYLSFKLAAAWDRAVQAAAAARACRQPEARYGVPAGAEDLGDGAECAICQEKMTSPVRLRCSHAFCEDCIHQWFERERTCPLCRAVIKPPGLSSYSDGTTSLLLQVF